MSTRNDDNDVIDDDDDVDDDDDGDNDADDDNDNKDDLRCFHDACGDDDGCNENVLPMTAIEPGPYPFSPLHFLGDISLRMRVQPMRG